MKKITRIEKSTLIIANAKTSIWCYVNTDNEFNFMNNTYIIDNSVEEYKVHNKAGTIEDYTNEAYMEEILAVVDFENNLKFYNQNYDEVELVSVKG